MQYKQGAVQVIFLQYVCDTHFVATGTRRSIESGRRRHEYRLSLVFELRQTPGTELVRIIYRKLCHRIECSHRDGRIYAWYTVQSVNQAFTAFYIFIVCVAQIILIGIQRCFCGNLAYQRRTETRLAELHDSIPDFLVLRYQGTDADAALRIALGHGINQHHIVLNALQMAGRDIGRTRINKFTVHLVREEEQIVLLHKVANLVHFTACIEVTRRIVGIANQNSTRALVNQLLELLYLGQRETLFDGRGNGAYLGSGRDGKRHIIGIGRLGNNDFIPRIEASQEREQHRLRAAGSDDDVVCSQIDIVLCIVTHQLLAVTAISRTGTVFQNFPVDVPYRFNRDFRSRQVGLTDVQVKYMYTPLLGSICQRSQFSDRRCGHLHSANRYCWHEVYLLFDDL